MLSVAAPTNSSSHEQEQQQQQRDFTWEFNAAKYYDFSKHTQENDDEFNDLNQDGYFVPHTYQEEEQVQPAAVEEAPHMIIEEDSFFDIEQQQQEPPRRMSIVRVPTAQIPRSPDRGAWPWRPCSAPV